MSEKENGGYAFPQICDSDGRPYNPEPGMSLRDWFAGKALSGLSSMPSLSAEHAAHNAYVYADAMLKVRNK